MAQAGHTSEEVVDLVSDSTESDANESGMHALDINTNGGAVSMSSTSDKQDMHSVRWT